MENNSMEKDRILARPFLKWAGGKTQLLGELENRLPVSIQDNMSIRRYVEPFVGGGAMFFFLKSKYQVKESVLLDVNPELIMAYQVLQDDHRKLIERLRLLEEEHLGRSEESRKENYYSIRRVYNQQMGHLDYETYDEEWIQSTAHLIFLNKTCFNGLFRLNSKGEFNVPFGRYKNPTIFDEGNLHLVHKALKNTKLLSADFRQAREFIEKETLVYLDPPYRPISHTSHFTSYSQNGFKDEDQKELANFYSEMDSLGAYLILSNSDPKNHDPGDEFFDELYKDYNIERVAAKRNINSNPTLRGDIKEIIVRNY
jgi:DNA adenine methylase